MQGRCGVVSHERHESDVSQLSDCYQNRAFFSNLPAFSVLNGMNGFKLFTQLNSILTLLLFLEEIEILSLIVESLKESWFEFRGG